MQKFIKLMMSNGRERYFNTAHIIDFAESRDDGHITHVTTTEMSVKDGAKNVVHKVDITPHELYGLIID